MNECSNKILWRSFFSLYRKEVHRFKTVWLQTIFAPVISILLYLLVFNLAFGGLERTYQGGSFIRFLVPGLIAMSVLQNSFANTSSSIITAKLQGSIFDVLVAPIGHLEFIVAYILGTLTRSLIVVVLIYFAQGFVNDWNLYSVSIVVYFVVSSSFLLSCFGLMIGILAVKFEHIALATNFVITPLSYLSGTFYSVDMLPKAWQHIALLDPFFYLINGVRYGFIGGADFPISTSMIFVFFCNVLVFGSTYLLVRSGYRLRS